MSGSSKKSKIVVFAVVTVLALNFGVIMPLLHVYQDFYPSKVSISVSGGYQYATFTGNFTNETYLIPHLSANSTITTKGQTDSYLNLSFWEGGIMYYTDNKDLVFMEYLSLTGTLNHSLDPASLTVFYSAVTNSTDSSFIMLLMPIPGTPFPNTNVSGSAYGGNGLDDLGELNVPLHLVDNATLNLLNQSSSNQAYHFSFYAELYIDLLYVNSAPQFSMGAKLNGLSEPVSSEIAFSIVEN
jgi:hypothetical protein